MPAFYRLPAELVGMVAEYCGTDDLFCFRQTCRWAKEGTSAFFSKKYFGTRRVMLQRQSLEALFQISQDPVLGPAVYWLEITMQHFLTDLEFDGEAIMRSVFDIEEEETSGNENSGTSKQDDAILTTRQDKEAYQRGYADQMQLQHTGLDAMYLVSILGRLRNCRSLEIASDDSAWGTASIERLCGISLAWTPDDKGDDSSRPFITRALQLVLEAVSFSNIRLDNLCVTILSVDDAMLALPGLDKAKLRGQLDSVKHLELVLELQDSAEELPHLVEFIKMFPSLEELVLSLPDDTRAVTSRKLSNVVNIPTIQKLRLQGGHWTARALHKFLVRHGASLRNVHFDCIVLLGSKSTWYWVFDVINTTTSIKDVTIERCKSDEGRVELGDLPTETRFGVAFVGFPLRQVAIPWLP